MKYEKAEAANTQRSFRLIAERIVKVWHGVRCCWHYGIFYRFGLIDVPDEVKEKMGHPKKRKK